MSYTKGRPLCPEEKKVLVSVKHYFDRNKAEFGSSESSVQMTADALGLGLATVNRVMATYRKDPDSLNPTTTSMLDRLIFPVYAASKGADHYQEATDVTG